MSLNSAYHSLPNANKKVLHPHSVLGRLLGAFHDATVQASSALGAGGAVVAGDAVGAGGAVVAGDAVGAGGAVVAGDAQAGDRSGDSLH